jgi:hypothetical protein
LALKTKKKATFPGVKVFGRFRVRLACVAQFTRWGGGNDVEPVVIVYVYVS